MRTLNDFELVAVAGGDAWYLDPTLNESSAPGPSYTPSVTYTTLPSVTIVGQAGSAGPSLASVMLTAGLSRAVSGAGAALGKELQLGSGLVVLSVLPVQ